jgi:ferredoxin
MITRRDAVSGIAIAVVGACTHARRASTAPAPPVSDAPARSLGLAMITDECINCGACEPECPTTAIRAGADIYQIDQDACTECVGFHGAFACQDVCPVECCLPDPSHLMTEADLLARAHALAPDETYPSIDELTADQSVFRAGSPG